MRTELGQHDLDLDLVVFDCDGVLVDSEVLGCRCLCEVLATHSVKLKLAEPQELFLGRSAAAVLQHYRERGRVLPDAGQPPRGHVRLRKPREC